ncbi:MAG: hypothetical protein M1840_002602 [Geoglossum simile]|nr:MAG: hypothetical protein M1840_002602 [Geoglossum simile]
MHAYIHSFMDSFLKTNNNHRDKTQVCRTPSKLTGLLTSPPRSLSESTLKNLTIHEGSSTDAAAVLATLRTPSGAPATVIIFSIGGMATFWPNPLRPRLTDPTICETSMATLLQAVGSLAAAPFLLAVSTMGLPSAPKRDVPLALLPLYRLMLTHPHADKEKMEALLEGNERAVVVRASLLTDGARLGVGEVRTGTEEAPAVGYTISREDVGGWVFERVVENAMRAEEFGGKKVTVTY